MQFIRCEVRKIHKRFGLTAVLLVLTNLISAQTVVSLSDGKFIYRLTVEQLHGTHYRHYINEPAESKGKKQIGFTVGTVKTITIINLKDTTEKQVIIPGENETSWPWTEANKAEKFIIQDMNFDGKNDIRLLNSADNFTYYCWVYQPATKQFVQDTVLNKLVNPQFDPNEQLVYVNWQGYTNKGTETFKYIEGKLTLIEEEETRDDGKKTTITIKKLVNGKMEVVNNVESIDKN